MSEKSGFGLIEVMAAAVVLGFLLVGLNILQLGNRESILRIRVRDAANNIAQDVIDSIAVQGLAGIQPGTRSCVEGADDLCRSLDFEGAITTKVDFDVAVTVSDSDADYQMVKNESKYVENFTSEPNTHMFAKNIDVTVRWQFKKTQQSINLSAVVR